MYFFKNGQLTDLDETLEKLVEELKNKLIMYMITKHNITWLNDETEKELYRVLLDFLEPFIMGKVIADLP